MTTTRYKQLASHHVRLCNYGHAYTPIYETAYDISFVFVDEEDGAHDYAHDRFTPTPTAPSAEA